MERDAELNKSQQAWLGQELSTKTAESEAFRSEKTRVIQRLQSESRESESQARSLQSTVTSLTSELSHTQTRLTTAQDQLQTQTLDAGRTENSLSAELTQLHGLNQLLKHSMEEKKQQARDVEQMLNGFVEEKRELSSQLLLSQKQIQLLQSECRKECDTRVSLQERVDIADALLLRASQQQNPLGSDSQFEDSLNLSDNEMCLPPSALATTALLHLEKSGKSFTQVFSDFIVAKKQIHALQQEIQHLRTGMEEVLQEVQNRSTHYAALQKAHNALVHDAQLFSTKLTAVTGEQKELRHDHLQLQQREKDSQADLEWTKVQNRDLTHQLNHLLFATTTTTGPPRFERGSFTAGASTGDVDPPDLNQLSNAQSVISGELVVFGSIEELQSRNVELLHLVRTLCHEKEQNEFQHLHEEFKTLTEKYELTVEQLHQLAQERRRSELLMENVLQENRMLKEIRETDRGPSRVSARSLSRHSDSSNAGAYHPRNSFHHDGTAGAVDPGDDVLLLSSKDTRDASNLNVELQRVQQAFQDFQHETTHDRHILQQDGQRHQQEANDLRVKCVTVQHQFDFAQNRLDNLNGTLERVTTEAEEARSRVTSLLLTNQHLEDQLTSIVDTERHLRSELKAAESRSAHVQSSLDLQLQEIKFLKEERGSLSTQISSLTSIIQHFRANESKHEEEGRTRERWLVEERDRLLLDKEKLLVEMESKERELKASIVRKEQEISRRDQDVRDLHHKVEEIMAQGISSASAVAAAISTSPSSTPHIQPPTITPDAEMVLRCERLVEEVQEAQQQVEVFKDVARSAENQLEESNATFHAFLHSSKQKYQELALNHSQLTETHAQTRFFVSGR